MSQTPSFTVDTSSLLLTLVASLYYFALQPWAILARSAIIILTFVMSKATESQQAVRTVTMSTSRSLIESIELKTKRTITIDTLLNDRNLAKCHPQQQSPLFCKIPKELRDYILELSCTQSPNERYPYDVNSYHYRPDHTAKLKTHTSLLRTCRRIWLESHAYPMRQAEHAFWFERGPFDQHPDTSWQANFRNEKNRYGRFLKSLNVRNTENVTHIHLFKQHFQLGHMRLNSRMTDFFPHNYVEGGFCPKRFTITLRSSDWADWEHGKAMSLPRDWIQGILDSPYLCGVDEFELELETHEARRDQLDAIVQRIASLEGKPKLADLKGRNQNEACRLVPKGVPTFMTWTRSPRINNTDHEAYKGILTLKLTATTLVWKNKACPMPDIVPPATYDEEPRASRTYVPWMANRATGPLMRSRALRERLRTGGWIDGRFPEKEDEMRFASVRKAVGWEQIERERFEKMFGDIEAKRLLGEWEEKASLLRFVEEETEDED